MKNHLLSLSGIRVERGPTKHLAVVTMLIGRTITVIEYVLL